MKRIFFALLILWAPLAQASIPSSATPFIKALMRETWDLRADRPLPRPHVEVIRTENRELHRVTFKDSKLGSFNLVIEGPRGFQYTEKLRPIVFITAGFFAGSKPLTLLREAGDIVAVAFEYTAQPEQALLAPESLANTLLQIPGRLYVSLRWLEKQSWFVPSQFHVVGVSLGTLYLPSALSLLQEDGFSARSYVFAFGGAETNDPLRNILRMNFGERETNETMKILGPLVSPLDPRLYLPTLRGRKLVIHADRDAVFRSQNQKLLNQSLSTPKVTCVIEGGHIDMDKPEEIDLTLGILETWIQNREWRNPRQERTSCRAQLH